MPASRGRPPKGEITGKSSVFTTRIRPELRSKLENSAQNSGRSLSQEVERRINDSFIQEGRMEDHFGSVDAYWIMRLIALSMQDTRIPFVKDNNWRTDPDLFDAAVRVANNVLESIRPGPPSSKSKKQATLTDWLVQQMPIAVLQTIQSANESLPLNEGTEDDHLASLLKRKLGSLVDKALENASSQMPSPDEWRARGISAGKEDFREYEVSAQGRKHK